MGGGGSGVMAASMTALAASGVHDKGGLVVRKKAFDNLHYARAHKNSFAFCFETNNTYKIVESRQVLCDLQNPLSFRFAFRRRLALGYVCQHFKPFKPENFDVSYLIGN